MNNEIQKVGAGELIWLLVNKATGRPMEGGAHTSEERAVGTLKQMEADFDDEVGVWEVKAIEIDW